MKTTTPTAAGPIPAIDLGRYKSVACAYDPATRAAAFRTLDTGREEFGRLFARHPAALVVVDADGLLAGLARVEVIAGALAVGNGSSTPEERGP